MTKTNTHKVTKCVNFVCQIGSLNEPAFFDLGVCTFGMASSNQNTAATRDLSNYWVRYARV